MARRRSRPCETCGAPITWKDSTHAVRSCRKCRSAKRAHQVGPCGRALEKMMQAILAQELLPPWERHPIPTD